MKARRVAAIALRLFYLYRGSPARIFPLLIWVAVDVLLWGFITRYLNVVANAKFDFVPALLGAVLFWDFLTRVMQGVTMAMFEDVWSRNFLNLFATPLTVVEYLTGLVVTAICTSFVSLAVMLVLAQAAFGLSVLSYGVALGPFFLVLFVSGIALGVAAAALLLRFGPAAEWLIWPIPTVISPFVGVFYPVSSMPLFMQVIAAVLPPSYVFEGMRAVVAGEPTPWGLLALASALSFAYLLLACWAFAHVFAHVIRNGLIARYSAETIG